MQRESNGLSRAFGNAPVPAATWPQRVTEDEAQEGRLSRVSWGPPDPNQGPGRGPSIVVWMRIAGSTGRV